MNSKPKVLFIQTFCAGVTYYRMYSFAQKMSELGLIHSRMFPAWDAKKITNPDWEDRLDDYKYSLLEMVKWADLIVCQYVSTQEGFGLIKTIVDFKPCFMEVDDFFKGIPQQHPCFSTCSPGEQQDYWASAQMEVSTGIICSTQYLADQFKQNNQKVHVIPNCIDFDKWDQHRPKEHEKIRIGWIGGATHADDLKLCKDVLYEILDRFPEIEVYIVSCPPPSWEAHERLHLVNTWATIDEYPKHVKRLSFDIGIAPLRDNYFNRAKSNLRYLEFSACRIPTVASDVEPFKKDFMGFIAWKDEDWFHYLDVLIHNHPFRKELGENIYSDVKMRFNLETISRQYAQIIQEAVN